MKNPPKKTKTPALKTWEVFDHLGKSHIIDASSFERTYSKTLIFSVGAREIAYFYNGFYGAVIEVQP